MSNQVISNIPLEDIIPSGYNRAIGGFDQGKLEQLSQSIREIGVQQPAVVRCIADGKYELVAGERRWRASKLAGVPTLPCVVKDLDDQAALRIQIVENIQREDVHPLDEAEGFLRLEKEGHCEVEYITQQVGKSPSYVYQRMKLHDLISPAKNAFASEKMSLGHAMLIARLPKDKQADALDILQEYEGMSVKEFDRRIQSSLLMQLSTATWKLDDEKLHPQAGSCKACPKRSGASPLLFEEVGKNDQCLDKECFAEKRKRLIEARREELEEVPHILVKSGYMYGQNAPEGTLESYEWDECKKKDPGAVRALIVTGPDAGRLAWGIPRVSPQGKRLISEEEKARSAKERKIKLAATQLRERILDSIVAATASGVSSPLLAEAVKKQWNDMAWDAKRLLAKRLGFQTRPMKYGQHDHYDGDFLDFMRPKNRQQLESLRIMIQFAGYLYLSSNTYYTLDGPFVSVAQAAGVDVDALVNQVAESNGITTAELNPPRKSWDEDADEDDQEDEGQEEDEEEEAE